MDKDCQLIFEAYKKKTKKPIADITWFRQCLIRNCPTYVYLWKNIYFFSDTTKPKIKEPCKRIKVWMTSFTNDAEKENVERECKLHFGERFIKLEDNDIRLYLRVNKPAYSNSDQQQNADETIDLLSI